MFSRLKLKGYRNKSIKEIIRTSIVCPHCRRIIDYDSILVDIIHYINKTRIKSHKCPCCDNILIEIKQKQGYIFYEHILLTDGKRELKYYRHYEDSLSFEYVYKQQGDKKK